MCVFSVYFQHMAKERFQITLNTVLVGYARQMMKPLGHDSLSEYLESLIREEARRQNITEAIPLPEAVNSPTTSESIQSKAVGVKLAEALTRSVQKDLARSKGISPKP